MEKKVLQKLAGIINCSQDSSIQNFYYHNYHQPKKLYFKDEGNLIQFLQNEVLTQMSFLNKVLSSEELGKEGILDLLYINPKKSSDKDDYDNFINYLEMLADTNDETDNKTYTVIAQQLTRKMESYSQIIGYLCGIYDQKTINDIKDSKNTECTIGVFIEQLVDHYLTWCIVQDIKTIAALYKPLFALKNQRNSISHKGELKKDPIDCCLTYIVVVNFICQKIMEAKNGGIRFKSSYDGDLVVSINNKSIFKGTVKSENPYTNKRVYDPRYQVSFPSKLNEGTPIQVEFKSKDGKSIIYDNVIARGPGEFIELEYPDTRNKESRLSVNELDGPIVTIYCKKLKKVTLKCEGQVIETLDRENAGVKLPWGKTIRIVVEEVLDPLKKVMENTIYLEMPNKPGSDLLVWDIDKKYDELINNQQHEN